MLLSIFIFPIITLLFNQNVFATTDVDANGHLQNTSTDAKCTEPVLGTYSGETDFEAKWTPNTIQLNWYDGQSNQPLTVQSNATSCTYAGALNIPTNTMSRTGYNFAGWKVRATSIYTGFVSRASTNANQAYGKGSGYCRAAGNVINADSQSNANLCFLTPFDNMNTNDWQAIFDYGTLYGVSTCSAKVGNNNNIAFDNDSSNWRATDAQITEAGTGSYCWCRATGFKSSGSDSIQNQYSAWYFAWYQAENWNCSVACAWNCAWGMQNSEAIRSAIYALE